MVWHTMKPLHLSPPHGMRGNYLRMEDTAAARRLGALRRWLREWSNLFFRGGRPSAGEVAICCASLSLLLLLLLLQLLLLPPSPHPLHEGTRGAAPEKNTMLAVDSCGLLPLLHSLLSEPAVETVVLVTMPSSSDITRPHSLAVSVNDNVAASEPPSTVGSLLSTRPSCFNLPFKEAFKMRICESLCSSKHDTRRSVAATTSSRCCWSCSTVLLRAKYCCAASFNTLFGCKVKDCKGAFVTGDVSCPLSNQDSMHFRW
mmetsp:Transcript_71172/g.179770  ORF Transcript_71172/g.179770 Transcript_71172/m.179770 type:complete len:258 (-) Transcript_71172:742-1515(-)